ncbi:MAG TPA: methionine biosynthesis protein MetW [Candidatus Paceibacterota bacterium]|nr:methionine biosynthesis protein MetW [Candidatus Paceibacterota bacterium]
MNFHYKTASYSKINRSRREAIIRLLGDGPINEVLDVGCGPGYLGEIVAREKEAKVFGLEFAPQFCLEARKRLTEVFCFNLEESFDRWPWDIKQKKFNKVLISEVLEHLFEPEELLIKLKGISDQEADFVVTVPNLLFWKNRLRIFAGHFEYTKEGLMDRGHIHFFSWRSFNQMIKTAGFKIVETAHHTPTRGTSLLAKLWPGLFAYQFIVRLQKNEN